MAPAQGLFWVSTTHDREWDFNKLPEERKEEVRFCMWKPEEIGRYHIHIYVEFFQNKRGKAVSEALGHPVVAKGGRAKSAVFNDLRVGTQAQAMAYVASDEYCHACHTGDCRQALYLFEPPFSLKPWVSSEHEVCRTIAHHQAEGQGQLGEPVVKYQCEFKGTAGDLQQFGTPSRGRSWSKEAKCAADNSAHHVEALKIAKNDGVDAAMGYIYEHCGSDYALRGAQLKWAFTECTTRPTFELRPLPADTVDTLWPWQVQLLELLKCDPVARTVIWVTGTYKSGKSWFVSYLSKNLKYGALSFGNSMKLFDCIHLYAGQGCVMWDCPYTFPWDLRVDAGQQTGGQLLVTCLETFSNYNTSMFGGKYKPKTIDARCNVVVFANRPPLVSLGRGTVVRIHAERGDLADLPLEAQLCGCPGMWVFEGEIHHGPHRADCPWQPITYADGVIANPVPSRSSSSTDPAPKRSCTGSS